MVNDRRCFFIGHRDAPEAIQKKLLDTVFCLVKEESVNEFVVGHYGRFDAMAASAVRTVKKLHSEISLDLLLPYYPIENLSQIAKGFDATFYPEGLEFVPKSSAIIKANEYMICNSRFLICYNTGCVGNTRRFFDYAAFRAQKGLIQIVNLAD